MTSATRTSPAPDEPERDATQQLKERKRWVERCCKIGVMKAELLMRAGMNETATKLLWCLRNVKVELYRERPKVIRYFPCHLRFLCPLCHYYWASAHAKKHGKRLRRMPGEGHRLYFLTLTVKSVPVLTPSVIDAIWECWRKLRRQQILSDCLATVAAMEVRKGDNGWQVHLHIIRAAASMLPLNSVRDAWYWLTKDLSGGYQVHEEPVEVATIERLIRYALKRPKLKNPEDLRALFNAARGRILIRPSGQARTRRTSSRSRMSAVNHQETKYAETKKRV